MKCIGHFRDPYYLAFRGPEKMQHLYSVSIPLANLWTACSNDDVASPTGDFVVLDVYEDWLESDGDSIGNLNPHEHHLHDEHHHSHANSHQHCEEHSSSSSSNDHSGDTKSVDHKRRHDHDHNHSHGHEHEECHEKQVHEENTDGTQPDHHHKHGGHAVGTTPDEHSHGHGHGHDHGGAKPDDPHHSHDHGHVHSHSSRMEIEQAAVTKEPPPSVGQTLAEALLRLLQRKGVVTAADIQRTVQRLEASGEQLLGAILVATAWKDAAFKARLLENGLYVTYVQCRFSRISLSAAA